MNDPRNIGIGPAGRAFMGALLRLGDALDAPAPVGRSAKRHDPEEGRGPEGEHAVTRDSVAGAQPIEEQQQ